MKLCDKAQAISDGYVIETMGDTAAQVTWREGDKLARTRALQRHFGRCPLCSK